MEEAGTRIMIGRVGVVPLRSGTMIMASCPFLRVSLVANDLDRPKRRRSPSPYDQASRTRFRSPTPPRYPVAAPSGLPDPAEVDYVLSFRQFSEWFRTSHPQTAKTDDEETRRVRSELESGAGGETGKEKVGMAKRYDRYRKEYTSRQVGVPDRSMA